MVEWRETTYPQLLYPLRRIWRAVFCPRGWHLFDEVTTVFGHYLHCDACGLIVHVARTELPDE